MADELLEELRNDLIEGLTEAVIRDLVDDLRKEKVLNKNETEDILHITKTRADQARDLIDSVKMKGYDASETMFNSLEKRDTTLHNKLQIRQRLENLLR
nr:caspase-1-A-like [Misgurnus anguillicaudatus]